MKALTGQRLQGMLESVALLLLMLTLWWLASHFQWVSKVFLPTPEATASSLMEGMSGGDLAAFTQATVSRMLLGWLLASLLGVALGALIDRRASCRERCRP